MDGNMHKKLNTDPKFYKYSETYKYIDPGSSNEFRAR